VQPPPTVPPTEVPGDADDQALPPYDPDTQALIDGASPVGP